MAEDIASDNTSENPSTFEVHYETVTNSYDTYDTYDELVVLHNGAVIARESDRGEPEDNLFSRDYAWIKPLLERVYALGFADGSEKR